MKRAVFFLALIFFSIPVPTMAGNLTASASYSFTDSLSDKEGCEIALTRVKKKVLEQVCGTQFSGGAGRFKTEEADEMSLFLFESVGGRIRDANLLSKDVTTLNRNVVSGDFLKQCSISAEVKVECDRGKRDPAFAPAFASDVQLNETVFRENDIMEIRVAAASGMYVSVFQYLPYEAGKENVFLVFPNQVQRDSFLKEGQTLKIPDCDSINGYRLAMRLPKGKTKVVEELMLVGSKKKVAFPNAMSLSEFHRILSEIPLDDRREAIVPYYIVKKGAERGVVTN